MIDGKTKNLPQISYAFNKESSYLKLISLPSPQNLALASILVWIKKPFNLKYVTCLINIHFPLIFKVPHCTSVLLPCFLKIPLQSWAELLFGLLAVDVILLCLGNKTHAFSWGTNPGCNPRLSPCYLLSSWM
jgi:hypothetical protein